MMTRLSGFLACVASIAVLLGAASEAQAFTPIRSCGGGKLSRWAPSKLPLRWKLNAQGSQRMPIAKIEQIFKDSFREWERPCCSGFRASYRGLSDETYLSAMKDPVMMSFADEASTWPPEQGNAGTTSTIAFTAIQLNPSTCELIQAPIHYNAVRYQYTDQCTSAGCGGGTDLQSIATHEIGHLLGLGHSNVQGSTMWPSYDGRISARTLGPDDESGVCSLYPGSCACNNGACSFSDETCQNNTCEVPACTNTNDCPGMLVCSGGECKDQPCTGNQDCPTGLVCEREYCRKPDCTVCELCGTNEDCGAGGLCLRIGTRNKCVIDCSASNSCPGNAACKAVPQSTNPNLKLCLNPGANPTATSNQNICPGSFSCTVPQNDPCQNVTCNAGEMCVNGACVGPMTCATTGCPGAQVCVNDMCVDPPPSCATTGCPAGQVCVNDMCVQDNTPVEDMSQDMPQDATGNPVVPIEPVEPVDPVDPVDPEDPQEPEGFTQLNYTGSACATSPGQGPGPTWPLVAVLAGCALGWSRRRRSRAR